MYGLMFIAYLTVLSVLIYPGSYCKTPEAAWAVCVCSTGRRVASPNACILQQTVLIPIWSLMTIISNVINKSLFKWGLLNDNVQRAKYINNNKPAL